jgi:type IV secretory pathway VirB10-like protein
VVTLQVEGEGNFDRIEAPPMIDPDGWRAYPPEATFAKSDDTGLRGIKTFRIALVPLKAHVRTPQFEFAAFDPNTATYQKQQNGISSLEVEGVPPPAPEPKQVEPPQPPPPKPEPKPEPKPVLAEQHFQTESGLKMWQSREWFWGLQLAAGILLAGGLGMVVIRGYRARQGEGPKLVREARALESRLRRMTERAAFFQTAVRASQLRAQARSGQPAAAADAADIGRAFAAGGSLQGELDWLFGADAETRFAGGGAAEALQEEERRRVSELLARLV